MQIKNIKKHTLTLYLQYLFFKQILFCNNVNVLNSELEFTYTPLLHAYGEKGKNDYIPIKLNSKV